jgi:membrane fusion protein (multidrug efflux system)
MRAVRAGVLGSCPGNVILLLSLLVILALSSGVAAAPPGPVAGPSPVVTVAPVTLQDVNPSEEYVGHVEAIQAVDLRARVEGFPE